MSEAFDFEYDEEQQDQGFVITDDQMADWAVRKIVEADKELERMEAWYALQLQQIRDKHDRTVGFFNARLAEYLNKVPAKETKTTVKYSLMSGDMVLTKAKPDFEAADEEKLLGWCQMNAPELVKVTMKPAWGDVKKRLVVSGDSVVDKDTGVIVDGVETVLKPASFKVRMKGE